MGTKRKNHSKAFKTKVALEAVKGTMTSGELASQFGVHPSLIAKWKKTLLDGASELFATGKSARDSGDHDALTAPLYQEIGRLKMEVDFLKKKC